MSSSHEAILSVKDLVVGFHSDDGYVKVLDRVGFDLKPGETIGLVGESGCGKSVTAMAIMRLLPHPAGRIDQGEIIFDQQNILKLPVEMMHTIRGRRIAMIFQEPMTALNPVHRIGRQLAEVYQLHFPDMDSAAVQSACIEMLDKVGIPAPAKRLNEYPHQLSGGMRQRVMIAMALACKPEILIADEPTTALDVTIQAQILSLIKELQNDTGMSTIFITHDLGVVAQMCDQVVVMYAGRILEMAELSDLFKHAHHPYTQGLLQSIPRLDSQPKTRLDVIEGVVPGLRHLPSGCRFRDRCVYAKQECAESMPELENIAPDKLAGHHVACIRWQDINT